MLTIKAEGSDVRWGKTLLMLLGIKHLPSLHYLLHSWSKKDVLNNEKMGLWKYCTKALIRLEPPLTHVPKPSLFFKAEGNAFFLATFLGDTGLSRAGLKVGGTTSVNLFFVIDWFWHSSPINQAEGIVKSLRAHSSQAKHLWRVPSRAGEQYGLGSRGVDREEVWPGDNLEGHIQRPGGPHFCWEMLS